MEAAKSSFPNEDETRLFNRYLKTGGVPFLAKVAYDADACRAYLQDLYDQYLHQK